MATIGNLLWKIPVVLIALVIGAIGACQVGWSLTETIVNLTHRGMVGHFFLNLLAWIGLLVSVGAYLLVRRIARPFLWVMVPVFLYFAVVLGAWDGISSGFDAARVNAVKHHFANADQMQRMSQRGRFLSCKDPSIHFTEDAKPICAQTLQAGPGSDTEEGCGPFGVFTCASR